jgi:hypothetical protein
MKLQNSMFVAVLAVLHAAPGLAATLLVSNTNDTGTGSLRQAIADNVTQGGNNTIVFAGNVTGTITLASRLVIGADVTILGPGPQVLTVSGNHVTRVFLITSGNIAISGLTVANGWDATEGNGIAQPAGSLTLNNCVIMNCTNATNGGGIYSSRRLSIIGCTICNNTAYNGGGLTIGSAGNVTILSSTICSNTSTGGFLGGGGGGGIYFGGAALNITNSTIFANSCISTGFGGGILNDNAGTINIASSTIASNACDFGNGAGIQINPGSARAFVMNTIIAGNSALPFRIPDCDGNFVSGGYNLIGSTNGSSGWSAFLQDQFGSTASPLDPRLGPLKSNGGPAPTAALLPDSPAIDSGNSFGLMTDQRGAPRPFHFASLTNAPGGDGSDIGAFELGSPLLNIQPGLDNNVVLSWPSCYGDFGLQTADALPTSNGWNTVTNAPVVIGNQFNVTNAASDAGRLYRLRTF